MTPSPNEVHVKLESKIEGLSEVEVMVNSIFESHGLNRDFYGNVLVAVTEAVNNAIKHGNQLSENKMVSIHCNLSEKKIEITVSDEGRGFDYDNLPDPTAPENLEKPDGRGVFLMKNLADKVIFEDEGRKVALTFNLG